MPRRVCDAGACIPLDPATLGVVVVLVTSVAVIAALVPAVRAARVDPMTVLRDE